VKKIIGERIRRLRQNKDYTQDNMAAELDITAGAYAKIERGETDPSATRLIRIAEILEVDVTYFFQNTPNHMLEEKNLNYGYASHKELEDLKGLVYQLSQELEKIKERIGTEKKNRK
jgi:transcriptional regulator with XRE-family HTH domain